MRSATSMTVKGQVTIPKNVRVQLGLRPGDRVQFRLTKHGFVLQKAVEESVLDKWVGTFTHLRGRDPDDLVDEMRGRDR